MLQKRPKLLNSCRDSRSREEPRFRLCLTLFHCFFYVLIFFSCGPEKKKSLRERRKKSALFSSELFYFSFKYHNILANGQNWFKFLLGRYASEKLKKHVSGMFCGFMTL